MAALTIPTVLALPPLEGYWAMDEGEGTLVADEVGGNDGTMSGLDPAVAWIEGRRGSAIKFDNVTAEEDGGTPHNVRVPDDPSISFADESFSISLLLRWPVEEVFDDHIITKGDYSAEVEITPGGDLETGKRFELFGDGANLRWVIDDNITKSRLRVTPDAFHTGEWVHVVAIRDVENNLLKLYADGVEQVSIDPGNPEDDGSDLCGDISNPRALRFGDSARDNSPIPADLDEIRIFRGVLTESDIAEIAELHDAPIEPPFDCDTGLGEDATYSLDTTQLIVGTAGFTSLDGTWSHDNGGDEWDGSEIGGTLGAGNSPGGVSQIEDYLRIQDAGNPTGHGYADPGSNRKLSFVHDLFEEGATNSFLDDGCTVFFRARLATDGLLDSLHPDGGLIGPVPAEGDGYQIHDNGKGNVMLNQLSNTGYIGFALATDETNPAGGAGLLMNNLNGNAQTGDVDTEDAGTVNFIELDPTVWHNYWITIQADTTDTGTHLVTAYVDCGDPQEFIVTIAGPDSLNAVNHVAIGAGSTPRSGAFDLAALMFAPTVIEPPSGGPSSPPNAASGWVLFD